MNVEIEIVPFREEHIPEILELWHRQYRLELKIGVLPNTWGLLKKEVEAFLRKQLSSEYSAVALRGGDLIGYMLFQVFPFHGEDTAFCPVVGHAEKSRKKVAERLYQHLSEKLVAKGVLSHCITYFAHDVDFEEAVFALGFGMIVIDVFRDVSPIQSRPGDVKIVRATKNNLANIKLLDEESRAYYLGAPIFLNRGSMNADYYRNLLNREDMAVFLAFVEEIPVGFMSVRRNKELRLIDLCDDETALIDEIGAYVKLGYRGRGIGASLLSKCIEWCRLNNLVRVHVDFESANILGMPFWLGFFKEAMRSVRRVVYSDLEPNK